MSADMDPKMERARAWVEACLGSRVSALRALPGGAGARRYWRVSAANETTSVLMLALPEDPAILPPALRKPVDGIPFVRVTRLLERHAIPVPAILAVEEAERWVLLEDLGDLHLCDLEGAEYARRCEEAIDLLAQVHALPQGAGFPFDRRFDEEWIAFELEHFLHHGLGSAPTGELRPLLQPLGAAIAELPTVLCLRDFQGQNLMIDASGRLRILDYQDALLAPPELDLAALLYDSYSEVPGAQRRALVERYQRSSGRRVLGSALALVALQRKLKDFGRFRLLVEVRGDRRYEPATRSAQASLLEILPALPEAQRALARTLEPMLQAVLS